MAKLVKFEELKKLSRELNFLKKTVVFTSGSFDLFHLGHARFLAKAKSLGDILVVGIPSNKSVRELKGKGRPIIDEGARAHLLTFLDAVDYVVIFPQKTILETLKILRPNIFFTIAEEWNKDIVRSPEAEFLKKIGAKIVRSLPQAPFLSASKIVEKVAGEMVRQTFSSLIKNSQEVKILEAGEPGEVKKDIFAPTVQMEARTTGYYERVWQEVAKNGKCVFCDLKEKYLIAEKGGVVLTVALFPYIDGHLLIVPRRHCEKVEQLNNKEWQAVKDLIDLGIRLLKKELKIENFWLMQREGENSGRTVSHLHFHLFPFIKELAQFNYQKINIEPRKLREILKRAL